MGFLDSFGDLATSIIAVLFLLVMAILSFFVTIFIVDAGAALAGYQPSGNFVTLSAAVLSAAAILGGATPMGALAGAE
jgi:hypothetical protein